MPSRMRMATLVLGFAALAVSCTEPAGLAAPDVEPNAGLLDGALGVLGGPVEVLHRTEPLAQDEVVSEVIGSSGGVIDLPEAGLTVYFPRYALQSSTTITVTAPAGDLVGYHFEPHGLQFNRDVRVVQDLAKTDAGLLGGLLGGLTAAYFEGDLAPVVNALEILDVNILGLLGLARFEIEHFSGYVVATN